MELPKTLKKSKLYNKFNRNKDEVNLTDSRDAKLYPSTGYTTTGSFIIANKRYGSVAKLTNHFGQNRNQTYGWFVNVIPEITKDNVKGYFVEVSKPLLDSEQKKVMSKTDNTVEGLDDENQPTKGNFGLKQRNKQHTDDILLASYYHNKQDIMIDSKKHLLLVSDNPDDIADQFKSLNDLYKEDYAGLQLESDAGDQEHLFKELITPPEGSIYEDTMMSTDYVGFDHTVRRGLNDDKGVPIGELTASMTDGTAMMDLNGSFKQKILVAANKSSVIQDYDTKLSASSMWGQKIANHAMAHGHKIFHIVLNDFDYYGEANVPNKQKTFSAEPIMNTIMKKINLAYGGLNPFQPFGEKEKQIQIYSNHLDKLVYEFYLYTNRTMKNDMITSLKKEINNHYESVGMWDSDAHKFPGRIRIIDKKRDSYPTASEFLLALTNYADEVEDLTDSKKEATEELVTSLEQLLNTHRATIDTYTTLPDPDEPEIYQYYYQLNDLEGDIKEAQFLNIFDYIAASVNEDDIVMIHGVDQLSTETARYIKNTADKLEQRDVRLAYLYDAIGRKKINQEKEELNNIEYCDIFNTNGIFYQDLENDFDFTIYGAMSKNDINTYQKTIDQNLPEGLVNVMTETDQRDQYLVRRRFDLQSNFVYANFGL